MHTDGVFMAYFGIILTEFFLESLMPFFKGKAKCNIVNDSPTAKNCKTGGNECAFCSSSLMIL